MPTIDMGNKKIKEVGYLSISVAEMITKVLYLNNDFHHIIAND